MTVIAFEDFSTLPSFNDWTTSAQFTIVPRSWCEIFVWNDATCRFYGNGTPPPGEVQTGCSDTSFVSAWIMASANTAIGDSEVRVTGASSIGFSGCAFMLVARWDGNQTSPTAYVLLISQALNAWFLYSVVAGVWTQLDTASGLEAVNTATFGLQVVGSNLAVKLWLSASESEPAYGPGLTDTSITTPGQSGIAGADNSVGRYTGIDNVQVSSFASLNPDATVTPDVVAAIGDVPVPMPESDDTPTPDTIAAIATIPLPIVIVPIQVIIPPTVAILLDNGLAQITLVSSGLTSVETVLSTNQVVLGQ